MMIAFSAGTAQHYSVQSSQRSEVVHRVVLSKTKKRSLRLFHTKIGPIPLDFSNNF